MINIYYKTYNLFQTQLPTGMFTISLTINVCVHFGGMGRPTFLLQKLHTAAVFLSICAEHSLLRFIDW